MLRCARCRRVLKSPAVVSGGQTFGPQCARKMNLPTGRARKGRAQEQAGQLALFEAEGVKT